jgi:hypothetical protein
MAQSKRKRGLLDGTRTRELNTVQWVPHPSTSPRDFGTNAPHLLCYLVSTISRADTLALDNHERKR